MLPLYRISHPLIQSSDRLESNLIARHLNQDSANPIARLERKPIARNPGNVIAF